MSINITLKATESLHRQFDRVADEAVTIMKGYAPRPSGAAFGKGSHSTGATRASIRKTRLGEWVWEIAPDNSLTGENGKQYVHWAEYGRGSVHPKTKPYLVFFDGHGNKHKVKSVGGMAGWYFVSKTAVEIALKYG